MCLTLALLSCSDAVGPGDLRSSIGVVYGWLTEPGGEPLTQARVEMFVVPLSEACELPDELDWLGGGAVTDAAGFYSERVQYVHVPEATRCIAVRVTPSGADGVAPATFMAGKLTLRYETLTPPVDSLRFDAVVSH